MHRLVIASFALAAAQGCIIIDDTETLCEQRDSGACFGVTADCPDEAVTYEVILQPVDATGTFPGTFDCGSGGAILVDPGTYDLRVDAADGPGDLHFSTEPILAQEVGDLDDVVLDLEFPDDKGFLAVSWLIQNAAEDEVTCGDAGAASVEVKATPTDGGSPTTEVFPCLYGRWQTSGLDLGDYDVEVTLIDGEDTRLQVSEPIPVDLSAGAELVPVAVPAFIL